MKFHVFYLKMIPVHVFDLKIIWVHVFYTNFSRVRMFYDDNCSKFVPEPIQPGSLQIERLLIA